MKKRLLIPIIISLLLIGCGGASSTTGSSAVPAAPGGNSASSSSGSADVSETTEEPKKELADMMQTDFYTCNVDDSFYYTVLVVKNESDETVHLDANFVAKDGSGNEIGAASEDEPSIAPGQTGCIWCTIDYSADIKSFDYTLTVDKEKSDKSIYEDVSMEYNTTDSGCIITATNSGNSAAKYVWARCIFFKNGEMVNFNEPILMDSDDELKPGSTITAEATCYSDGGFDDVIVILSGRE